MKCPHCKADLKEQLPIESLRIHISDNVEKYKNTITEMVDDDEILGLHMSPKVRRERAVYQKWLSWKEALDNLIENQKVKGNNDR